MNNNKQQVENVNTRQRENILAELGNIINRVSGIEITQEENPDVNFFELGLDSLMVVRIGQGIQKMFGLEMKVSQFYEEASTINNLVAYIEQHLPSDWNTSSTSAIESANDIPSQIVAPPVEISTLENVMSVISEKPANQKYQKFASASAFERILSQQLKTMSKLMSQQLEVLKNTGSNRISQPVSEPVMPTPTMEPAVDKPTPAKKATSQTNIRSMALQKENLTPKQEQFIKDLIARYTERTQQSKAFVQETRSVFSDWINSLGFRLSLKELKYPIVASKALGSKIWDIDGNEYIDIAIGYGVSYFGNRAPFIVQAIEAQLQEGFELGPQTPLGAEVAKLIHELTGMERVAFCNTGSEAVMFALRMARTVTKKQKIVLFAGSYHGNSDGVLATQGEEGTIPVAPGIPESMVENVLVLHYGTLETLATIEAHAHELAAVLVEPVQSRRPGFQPKEFLQQLRELTAKTGVVLIFDEMITGFRIHPGGAQAWFDVQADLVTYGKIVGGGMPIGVVAGKAKYMSAIDGGLWNFGDSSSPNQTVTFFAGTFCKHPLSMVAARAVLRHLKEQGSALQTQVNERTARFARTLNEFFKTENVAIRVAHFGSLFRFESFGKYHQLLEPIEMILLFYLLMEKGVYAWERYICFFSTAHTDEDIESIIQVVKESIEELREGGFTLESAPLEKQTYPMSSAQKRLFVLNELDGEQSSYQTPKAFMVEGELNVQQLEQCFAEIVNRHDSLRTTFAVQADGDMIQQVYTHVDFNVLYQESTEDKVAEIVKDFIRPFDFTKAPIMRVGVVKLSTHRYLLLFDTHHIVLDGLSTNILVQEFTLLYQGKTLSPVLKQYKDYGLWQQTQFETEKFAEEEAYWIAKFSDTIPVIDLPVDYPRALTRSSKGSIIYSSLSQEKTNYLKSLARQIGITLNMLLLGICNAWLHRLTGQEDIIVGSPVSGRPAGFEHSLGMFANTIAMRNQPKGNLLFKDFLHQVKSNAVHDYDHQDYPFENLVDKLNLQRDISRNPLFDVMFVYERADDRIFKIKNLTFSPYDLNLETAGFDIVLEAIEQDGLLSLMLTYATDIFKRETIERWLGYFKKMTQDVIKNPNQRLCDIDMLPQEEKQRLLVEFNHTKTNYPQDKTIIDLFEEQVVKTPEAIAVVFEDQALSYNNLNQKANQLGQLLQQKRKAPGKFVPVLMSRSLEVPIAFLAIMKAGAAFVPIDIHWPEARIQKILQQLNSEVVLINSGYSHLSLLLNYQVIEVDPSTLNESVPNLENRSSPNDPIYVIYTSGTTGEPKGAINHHRGIVNRFWYMNQTYGCSNTDVILQTSYHYFDAAVWQLLWPLVNGARTVIPSPVMGFEPAPLIELIEREKITITDFVPSVLELFLDELSTDKQAADKMSSLRQVLVGGETMNPKTISQLQTYCPHLSITNAYGPAETSIGGIFYEVPKPVPSSIPIGKPTANVSALILDKYLALLPIGIPGELYIGGVGVGLGYLNNETETQARFINNPFKVLEGEKLYKTGDLARYWPDGNIEFLGRMDNQIKIRGFRVELDEIETVLAQHSEVRETAVVIHQKESSKDKQLVAYLVLQPNAGWEINKFRHFLSGKLPNYMIPSAFVQLEALPLTLNGKTDRQKLAQLSVEVQHSQKAFVAPRTSDEELVAKIWQTVLGVKRVGIHDNFFELGGHSIKAMYLVSKMRGQLEKEVNLPDIFVAPTIAELIHLLDQKSAPFSTTPIEVLKPQSYYEVSNAQKRLWLIEQMTDNPVVYNMHVAYLLEGFVNVVALQNTLEAVVSRHESLRTVFTLLTGELKQKILPNIACPLEVIDLSNVTEPMEKARQYYRQEAATPFDLQNGPLFRAKLLTLSAPTHDKQAETYVFIINAHHLIFDGWSTNILFQEILELYRGYCQNQAPNLPSLRVQYKDYATWFNQLLASDTIKPHRDYWLNQLSGELPVLDFPLDYPRPEQQRFQGQLLWFDIDNGLKKQLQQFSREHDATLFMTLLSVIEVCLYYYSSQLDIIIGIPSAGRIHPDLENQVGFYLNMLPLRTILDRNDTLEKVLEKVKQASIEAYQHEIYPYDSLVEDLHLEKNTSRHHLLDIIVNFVQFEQYHLVMDHVQISTFLEESQTSRADFQFMFTDEPELLRLSIEYNTDLFKPETVKQVAETVMALLQIFVNNIHTPLKEVKNLLLTAEEKVEQQDFLQTAMNIEENF